VSAKYKQDNYLMIGFDEYGGKVFSTLTDGQSLTQAQDEGRTRVSSGECKSFAILRVLYNSIDAAKADRWMPKEPPIVLDPGPPSCVTSHGTTTHS
jgi:hypothetical protein